MQFRHEVKHEISNHDMLLLRQRLRAVMKPDSHAINGRYEIRSLYFDNLDDKALREKLDGVNIREKYKPDSMSFGGGRGNGKDFNMDDFMNREEAAGSSDQQSARPDMGSFDPSSMFGGNMPDMGGFDPSQMPQGFGGDMPDMSNFDPSQAPQGFGGEMPQMPGMTQGDSDSESDDKPSFGGKGGFGGFGMGSSDVKLQYVGDDIDSYSNIWNNAKTDITAADQTRLIQSLKKLSNKEQLESVVDIESVIRYFVVHNYVCNGDSYTGSMIHNYYLYEENGQMSMIPWDYNLAFGTFQGCSAQSTVNTPIDAPVSGGAGEDRPMWNWILSDESYTELYHQYFAEFLNTVDVQAIINNAYDLIKPYVEKDPTAFYTYEEFETGAETLRRFCELRSESISMQLESSETTTDMSYVDASGLTTSDMGSMGGRGGFGGDRPGGDQGRDRFGGRKSTDANEAAEASIQTNALGPSAPFGDAASANWDLSKITDAAAAASDDSENTSSAGGERPSRESKGMPGGNWGAGMNGMGSAAQGSTGLIWLAVSVLILGVGLLIAKAYRL